MPGLVAKSKTQQELAVARDPENLEARRALAEFYAVAPAMFGGGKPKAREQASEIKRRNRYQGLMAMAWVLADDFQDAQQATALAQPLIDDPTARVVARRALGKALLLQNRAPTEADIKRAISGNLCRCTGYLNIVQAVRAAALALSEE